MTNLKLSKEQSNRIINRGNFKYRQQKSNLKRKLYNNEFDTHLTRLLVEEIKFLNSKLEITNNTLLDRDNFTTHKIPLQ